MPDIYTKTDDGRPENFFLQSKEKNFDRFHNNCLRLAINTFLYLPISIYFIYMNII